MNSKHFSIILTLVFVAIAFCACSKTKERDPEICMFEFYLTDTESGITFSSSDVFEGQERTELDDGIYIEDGLVWIQDANDVASCKANLDETIDDINGLLDGEAILSYNLFKPSWKKPGQTKGAAVTKVNAALLPGYINEICDDYPEEYSSRFKGAVAGFVSELAKTPSSHNAMILLLSVFEAFHNFDGLNRNDPIVEEFFYRISIAIMGYDGYSPVENLGLSVNWASMNLGADVPESFGDYYSWGSVKTSPDTIFTWSNCPYYSDASGKFSKYVPAGKEDFWAGNGSPDNLMTLETVDDAAALNLKKDKRMPTDAEFEELCSNCKMEWKTWCGTSGIKFTSKKNNKFIFIPAAGFRSDEMLDGVAGILTSDEGNGCYWSSSVDKSSPDKALYLNFEEESRNVSGGYRYVGMSIRPVSEKK